MDEGELKKVLGSFLRGRWAILGIGNRLRGDDAFGSLVAGALKEAFSDSPVAEHIFDGGIAPENYYGKLARAQYERILILDAVVFDAPPGTVEIFRPKDFASPLALTHGPTGFEMLSALLPNTQILIVAARPQNTSMGANLSLPVANATESVTKILAETITKTYPKT